MEREVTFSLSARELTILRAVCEGRTAKEIALDLNISARTVEKHIERAQRKLGAKNRAHMVFVAVATGLVTPSIAPDVQ